MPDLKITQLTALASPALDDLVAVVDDVAGTPTTKKATLADVIALVSGGAPFTAPVLADFTWVNQGGATAVQTNGGIYLLGPASASHDVRALVKAAPATPYTITAAFLSSNPSISFLEAGLIFRQSGDGKLVTCGMETTNGFSSGWSINSLTYNSPTSAVAEVAVVGGPPLNTGALWLRIADNGTNRILSWSADGQNWRVLQTVGRTSFLTADQVGFFVNSLTASWQADMTLLSWKEA